MDTSEMNLMNVAVYKGEELIGYVAKTIGSGACVVCEIGDYRFRFPQRRATAIRGAASKATVVAHKDGRKFYPRGADKLTFKLVDHYHR